MTYRKRSSDEIRADIINLESMLAGLKTELEYAIEREAAEYGTIDDIIASLQEEHDAIMKRIAEIDELRAAERARRASAEGAGSEHE